VAVTPPLPHPAFLPARRAGAPLAAPPVDRVKGRRRRPRAARPVLGAGGRTCYVQLASTADSHRCPATPSPPALAGTSRSQKWHKCPGIPDRPRR